MTIGRYSRAFWFLEIETKIGLESRQGRVANGIKVSGCRAMKTRPFSNSINISYGPVIMYKEQIKLLEYNL